MNSKKLIVIVAIVLIVGTITVATRNNWLPWVNAFLSWIQTQVGVDAADVFQIPTTP